MVWLAPAALLGLLAIAGPVLVHMLQRRKARRTVFPSLRFVTPGLQSSARIRRVSDFLLLGVRAAIIASAALALAQPLLLGEGRFARWDMRVARAVIVDTSESARGTRQSEAIRAETSSADYVTTIEARHIPSALERAVAWLSTAPPARREIVVVSDFQRGALRSDDLAHVPAAIGLRFARAAGAPAAKDLPPLRVLDGGRVLAGRVVLDGVRTSIAYSPENAPSSGLQILAPRSEAAAISSLLRVVARAGAAAPAPSEPIVIRFPGAARASTAPPSSDDWTFMAALRILDATRNMKTPISVGASGGSLIVDVDAHPASLEAAQAVHAALDARLDPRVLAEAETERIPAERLAVWSRPAGPPDPARWHGTDESDGRWLWALTLVLLGAEAFLRRSSAAPAERAEANAA